MGEKGGSGGGWEVGRGKEVGGTRCSVGDNKTLGAVVTM